MTLSDPTPLLFAFGASTIVALAAWRVRSLSTSGAVAAAVVGGVSLSASLGMGLYLIAWFALATALSKIGKQKKAVRLSGVVEKSSRRDAWQVLANGGVYLLCSAWVYALRNPGPENPINTGVLMMCAAGSLAASGADTWATEIGTLVGGAPWSLRSRSRVTAGTSGAITVAGTIAMFAGAITLAFLGLALRVVTSGPEPTYAWLVITALVALGGIVGAMTDTVIGAWMQERRWCPRCTTETEQKVHNCGTSTVHHRGASWLNNDVVNFICSFVGAVTPFIAIVILTVIFEGLGPE